MKLSARRAELRAGVLTRNERPELGRKRGEESGPAEGRTSFGWEGELARVRRAALSGGWVALGEQHKRQQSRTAANEARPRSRRSGEMNNRSERTERFAPATTRRRRERSETREVRGGQRERWRRAKRKNASSVARVFSMESKFQLCIFRSSLRAQNRFSQHSLSRASRIATPRDEARRRELK